MVMSMVKYDAVVKVKQKSIQDLSTLDIVKAFTVIKLVSVQITMQQPGCWNCNYDVLHYSQPHGYPEWAPYGYHVVFQDWLFAHKDHPYPTTREKEELAQKSDLTQVCVLPPTVTLII